MDVEGSQRMFASMRRYRLQPGALAEFTRRVDESFADDIAAQPGFVSYQLIDCGGGDLFTLSIFLEPGQAEASRTLAQRWTEDKLQDIEHTRFDAIHGESVVGRAAPEMLDPVHVDDARKSVSIRYYRLRSGSVHQLMQQVDQDFADRMRGMPGFEASHLLDCDDNEVLWISVLRDADAVEQADELTARFVREELTSFRPEHVVSIRGDIAVSRANAELLEPAHA
jgi:heme-degrading monooxygenase HmoA